MFQRPRKGTNGAGAAVLSDEASAILRDKLLLAELEGFVSQDELDAWTLHAWPKANTLAPADGDEVREAFQSRINRPQAPPAESDPPPTDEETRSRIDKSVLALPEVKRLRDKQHLRFVAKQPCLICGRQPCDRHHWRFAQIANWGTRLAMNLRCRSAEHITANSTAPA
jgi:hypothetical protein